MTGSHNLGMKARWAIDDNLIIGQGNAPLAQAYALNITAIYRQHANARAGAPAGQTWTGLEDDDTWQDGHLSDDAPEMAFWQA